MPTGSVLMLIKVPSPRERGEIGRLPMRGGDGRGVGSPMLAIGELGENLLSSWLAAVRAAWCCAMTLPKSGNSHSKKGGEVDANRSEGAMNFWYSWTKGPGRLRRPKATKQGDLMSRASLGRIGLPKEKRWLGVSLPE